ncbi:MAG: type II toxin-antitoxin system HipA family toxin [Piscinibacter sp.]|uniref:type II toxin-antitoxin system HipA family toxin n=1 Tax=Piscinibacter sp. TaxID=1903157 RepID=UPI003D118248
MADLHVWMNGMHVGVWSALRTGTPVFRYDEDWVRAEEGRALSLSLPFSANLELRGDAVKNYFDNLLPDSADIRRRLRSRFRARSAEAFDLLSAIGRDCVGAVHLLPPGEDPIGWNTIDAEPLDEAGVERILGSVTSDMPLGQQGDNEELRLSIAGAQEKTALLKMGRRWYRPRGATPTTHILKLPLGRVGNMRADMSTSIENEWLCSRILRALGLPVAETEMARFGDTKALIVTRFDRRWVGIEDGAARRTRFRPPDGAWIARLPQEDFCQALGVAPDRKYQSDGGPSMQDCLAVLSGSEHAQDDQTDFVLSQFAFWLLAATDGHAKNFSIQHRRGGRFGLAPLYDVLSAWPIIGNGPNHLSYQRARLAMGLKAGNMHYRLRDIQPRHWQALAAALSMDAWPRVMALAQNVDAALSEVEAELPEGFPSRVWDSIASGMRRHVDVLLQAPQTSH